MSFRLKMLAVALGVGVITSCSTIKENVGDMAAAAKGGVNKATFNADGSVAQPVNWRRWVFVGAPLTPNALNGGAAPFPEYHNVYVEPSAFDVYENTGVWPEGTQIAKELTLVRQNNNDEIGASIEVSGRGYQQGEFSGLELTVKDTERFADMPGGWAYFSFGHKPQPYETTAKAFRRKPVMPVTRQVPLTISFLRSFILF